MPDPALCSKGTREGGTGDAKGMIPGDLPHRVMNRSGAPCRARVAHSATDDQEGIVRLPELDRIHQES